MVEALPRTAREASLPLFPEYSRYRLQEMEEPPPLGIETLLIECGSASRCSVSTGTAGKEMLTLVQDLPGTPGTLQCEKSHPRTLSMSHPIDQRRIRKPVRLRSIGANGGDLPEATNNEGSNGGVRGNPRMRI